MSRRPGKEPIELEPERKSNDEHSLYNENVSKRLDRDDNQIPFVHRIPDNLRRLNEAAYSPQLVSIGPLHYKETSLIQMEKSKLQYMSSFLSRKATSCNAEYESCIRIIESQDELVRGFYAEDISLDSSELAELLVVDGCFILELLLRGMDPPMYFTNDPIFHTAWILPSLRRDLILLENQIPFLLLEDLYKEVICGDLANLMDCVVNFFSPGLGFDRVPSDRSGQHLLDVLRNCYITDFMRDFKKEKHNWQCMRRATALTEVGVKFSGLAGRGCYMEFDRWGIIFMTKLPVHENTEVLFRNLIALEHLHPRYPQYITSYALLIGRLLEDSEDVKILQQKNLLKVSLGPGQDVSSMFKDLCKGVSIREFYFATFCERVDKFCEKPSRKYRAIIFREYLKEPWAMFSLMAAVIFLGLLPLIQTIYTVLSYYKQK